MIVFRQRLGPVKSTFFKAIKIFLTWPGLSEKKISNYLHPQTETAKEHLAQTRNHLQSTNLRPVDNNVYLENIRKNIKAIKSTGNLLSSKFLEEILRALYDIRFFTNRSILYPFNSDISYRSARGNEYILVAYHYDANVTLAQPLKK